MIGKQNLARQAERRLDLLGDYDALFFEGSWRRSGWLQDQAVGLATGLAQLGVRPGDRVMVLMANCPEVLVAYHAIWRAGGVVTPLIFLASQDELRQALNESGAVGVVTTAEFLPKVQAALPGTQGLMFVVTAGEVPAATSPDGELTIPVMDFAGVAAAGQGTVIGRADDDLAALLFTGGTTGRAKGVPLTHANLYWAGSASYQSSFRAGLTTSLLPLPLAHAYGLLVTCIGLHQVEPEKTILMRWFKPDDWLELAQGHRAQRTALVPSMIQMLLAQPLADADLSALTVVTCGASTLAAETRDEFEARVPGAVIYEGYGCTETASIVTATPLDARRPGSAGLPLPGCEVAIKDDQGRVLPPGADGEICVRSPGVLSAYWRAPDTTAAALRDGWFHTGDIGRLDDGGYLYVLDRKKDLIIRGGFNVYPRDVEDVLLSHPAVAQAAVIGRPDSRLGEEVVGFVALRPGAAVGAEELIGHARARLAASKYPREIKIVPAIPLTSVGKVDRKRLRVFPTA